MRLKMWKLEAEEIAWEGRFFVLLNGNTWVNILVVDR